MRKALSGKGMPWDEEAPSVLFVHTAQETAKHERENRLRNYLSLGTLTSALRDKSFLQRFAGRAGLKKSVLADGCDCPSFDVQVWDLTSKPEAIRESLEGFLTQSKLDPAMICTTATSAQLDEAKKLAEAAKIMVPYALRVIGGPHVSVMPREFLKESEYQVACVGEGVETISELALRVAVSSEPNFQSISGIAWKDGSGYVGLNPVREQAFGLDDYPFPSNSLDLFLDDWDDSRKNEKDLVYIFAGSGCSYQCSFCAQHAIHRGKIRERSADSIFAEIQKLFTKGFRNFALVQETFLSNRTRIDRFCHLVEESGLNFQWTVEARADQIDFELLRRMKGAGLKFVQIGLESGDQRILHIAGKGVQLNHVKRLRDWCQKLEINTVFYMLVGLPGQDWQSILRSAVFLREHLPYNRITRRVSAAIAIPYPGTRIAEDRSVRLAAFQQRSPQNWPKRTPEFTMNADGELIGTGPTETDDMTRDEILESLFYLYGFGRYLLRALYEPSRTAPERVTDREYASRMLSMIERRTIRDLIVRAQADLTPEKRKRAYVALLEKDGNQEAGLRKVTEYGETDCRIHTDFLTRVRFLNGYPIMKWFTIANRIKWMRICSIAWQLVNPRLNLFFFAREDRGVGQKLNGRLEKLGVQKIDRLLWMLNNGLTGLEQLGDVIPQDDGVKVFGLKFYAEEKEKAIVLQTGSF